MFDLILDLAKKKAWLREECGWVLHAALKSLGPGGDHDAETLIQFFDSNSLSKSPEGIALWITARSMYPGIQVPKNVWKHGDPLHRKERTSLARALKETSSNEDSKGAKKTDIQRGTWVPRLHYAWDVVFEGLLKAESSHMEFSDLWVEAVDSRCIRRDSHSETSTVADSMQMACLLLHHQRKGSIGDSCSSRSIFRLYHSRCFQLSSVRISSNASLIS